MEMISKIRAQLNENSSLESQRSFQRFFKVPVLCYGVKSAVVAKIAKTNFVHVRRLSKSQLYDLCEALFKSRYCEESWIASNWVYWKNDYAVTDLSYYERWIDKYIDNWAKCDTFCNHVVGAFIDKYPKHIARLKIWAKSKNLWLRRAAAVSLIIPAKEGKFLKNIFEIADTLLNDKEDMVQKGYGWLLKEASRTHQKEVFEYVMKHKDIMPRTALRYAIEKMPDSLRKKALSRLSDPAVL